MAKKKYKHGELSNDERARLDAELEKYLLYTDEDETDVAGVREDAPDEVKDYYARLMWEEEELERTGIIFD